MTWLAAASAAIALGCALASARRLVWALCPTRFDARLLWKALGAGVSDSAPRLLEAVGDDPRASWERAVLDALGEGSKAARDARLSEALTDFELLAQRWARVPRVCASVATTAGFLFASIGLIRDLSALDRVVPDPGGGVSVVSSEEGPARGTGGRGAVPSAEEARAAADAAATAGRGGGGPGSEVGGEGSTTPTAGATSDRGPDRAGGMESILSSALDALAIGVAGTSFCAAAHMRARRAARDRFDAAVRLIDGLQAIETPGALFVALGRFV